MTLLWFYLTEKSQKKLKALMGPNWQPPVNPVKYELESLEEIGRLMRSKPKGDARRIV